MLMTCHRDAPDLRVVWLVNLAKQHAEQRNNVRIVIVCVRVRVRDV
jgi:hypothetical protein